jgi:hypothetical protein
MTPCFLKVGFYFDISCERLLGYLWCVKVGKTCNVINFLNNLCVLFANTHKKKVFLWLYTFLIYIISFKYNHSANHITCSFILTITSLLSHILLHLINHITNWIINYVSYHTIQSYYFIQTITSSLCHILLHSIENIITCFVSHLLNHIVTWVINL